MLVYLGTGYRQYNRKPVEENRRKRWEFQAVVRGSIAPLSNGETGRSHARHMWLHHPDSLHGWTSTSSAGSRTRLKAEANAEADIAAEVIVFHFDILPQALSNAVTPQQPLEEDLSRQDIQELRHLAKIAQQHSRSPTELTAFYHELIAHRVGAIMLRSAPQKPLQNEVSLARYRVEAARAWYEANLANCPNLEDVAAAVYLSPAHLRRMFKTATGASMRDDLRAIQTAHIEDLLLSTDWPLYRIAEACGFRNQEVFSRSFRQHHGTSPSTWRLRRTRVSHRDK